VALCGCLAAAWHLPEAGASTRTASVTLTTPFTSASATAHCPRGERATGGGFVAPPIDFSSADLKVFASHKVGQRAWKVSAEEEQSTPADLELRAYVYCSRHVSKTDAASQSVPVPQGVMGFTSSKARCESGKAQSGGFALSTPNYDGNLIGTIRSSKRTWRTRIDGDIGVTVKSFVYCAKGEAPLARSGQDSETGSIEGTASSRQCPTGTHPIAGGFEQPDAITGFAGNSYRNFTPDASRRSASRWTARGLHGGNTSSTLVSTAYCG
jgi:hypothetical protein